jgi:hypothetical protein
VEPPLLLLVSRRHPELAEGEDPRILFAPPFDRKEPVNTLTRYLHSKSCSRQFHTTIENPHFDLPEKPMTDSTTSNTPYEESPEVQISPADLALATKLAQKKGLDVDIYLKALIHNELMKAG